MKKEKLKQNINYNNINFWDKKKSNIRSDIIVTPQLIKILQEQNLANKKVLDLGCGDGSITNYLKKQGADIIGLDINKGLINKARKKYGNFFKIHDISKKLPFQNETFDIVFSSLTFLHLDKKGVETIYSEINRILKKKGIFILADIHPHSILFKSKPNLVKYLDKEVNYFSDKIYKAELKDFKGKSIILEYFNHQLSDLLNLALKNNLELKSFKELKPTKKEVLKYGKLLSYEQRYPSYIIVVFQKKYSNYELTLKEIESMEYSWKYYLSEEESKKHSYGRVPEDGNEVAFWSVPKTTANILYSITQLLQPKNVLELGCSVGYSTLHIAKALENSKGKVYTTEILKQKIKLAKENFKKAGLSNKIKLIEKNILEVLKNWDKKKKIDFVFMDADKEQYKTYYELILPLLSEKGLIIVDNAGLVRMPDGRLFSNKHIEEFKEMVLNDERVFAKFYSIDNGLLLIYKKGGKNDKNKKADI